MAYEAWLHVVVIHSAFYKKIQRQTKLLNHTLKEPRTMKIFESSRSRHFQTSLAEMAMYLSVYAMAYFNHYSID